MSPFVTIGPLTTLGETTHYSIGPFPARVTFQPSKGPFFLGLIPSIRLLTTRYWPFLLVGQIQPVVTVGPFVVR